MKFLRLIPSIVLLTFLSLAITQCKKDKNPSGSIVKDINGFAEKGPFINGSSVTVYDLQNNLTQTGKSYNSQIINHQGEFHLSDISLTTGQVLLKADGYYYNEVLGKQSDAPITLYSLAKVSDEELNINILTHLEKARIEFLMKNNLSFDAAKSQAQKEILAIFNIEKSQLRNSEQMRLSDASDDNAILIAIAAMIQGYRTESEMLELLSNISNDLKEDGKLDDAMLGSNLLTHAIALDTNVVKNNLIKRYQELGITVQLPDFGYYIQHFINNTTFTAQHSLITYPEKGRFGDNILYIHQTNYASGQNNRVSLAANLTNGTSLRIKISSLNPIDTNKYAQVFWFYSVGSEFNWSISQVQEHDSFQTFTAIESGKSCDVNMHFDPGTYLIEYFEMNAITPTRTKTIVCD